MPFETTPDMKEIFVGKENKKEDRSTWATGGGVMLGIGVGFFFLGRSPLYFVGCLMAGLGVGLMVSSILWTLKNG